jgi:hypothetical protein
MWPQCGVARIPHMFPVFPRFPHLPASRYEPYMSPRGEGASRRRAQARSGRAILWLRVSGLVLTAHPPRDYIKPIRRVVRSRRDVAPVKHLTDIR